MQEIFVKSLGNLTKMVNQTKQLNKQLGAVAQTAQTKLTKSFEKLQKLVENIKKTFNQVFSTLKNIGLVALGTLGGFGVRGVMAQKQVAQAKDLGVTTQERGALQYAGRGSGRGEDFYKDILANIKNAILSRDSEGALSKFGLSVDEARNMQSIDLLKKALEGAKSATSRYEKAEDIIAEDVSSVLGIDLNTLKALDLSKFNKDLSEGMELTDNSADKLKGIGESLNKVITSFSTFMDKMLVPFVPIIEGVFNNISESIKKIGKSDTFNKMLKDLGNWALEISKNFDKTFESTLKELPQTFNTLKVVTFNLISGLSWLISFLPGIGDKMTKKLEGISNTYKTKAQYAELEGEGGKAISGLRDYLGDKKITQEQLQQIKSEYLKMLKDEVAKKVENFNIQEANKFMKEAEKEFDRKITLDINITNPDGSTQKVMKTINAQKRNS